MPKKITKKVTTKKSTSLVPKDPNAGRRLAWGGVMPQVGKSESDTQKLAVWCNQVAQVYGVPSMGVNAMSGNPYLNKDGRLYLLAELRKGKSALKESKTEFIQLSTSLEIPAIVKKTLVFRDGVIVDAIGEASKDNVKLDAVKKTLNMMAETRATNRAIWQAIAGDVYNRVSENLAKMQGLSPEDKARIVRAGSVSAEEMDKPERPENFVATSEDETIADLKVKVDDADSIDKLMEYSQKLEASPMPKRVKDELRKYISIKVDALSPAK